VISSHPDENDESGERDIGNDECAKANAEPPAWSIRGLGHCGGFASLRHALGWGKTVRAWPWAGEFQIVAELAESDVGAWLWAGEFEIVAELAESANEIFGDLRVIRRLTLRVAAIGHARRGLSWQFSTYMEH